MNLTKNFTLAELAKQDSTRLEKDQKNPIFKHLTVLAESLQSIRNYYGKGIIVTSGYRSPSYNKQVGGSPTSQHVTGYAADLKPADGNMSDLQRFILLWARSHDFDQIILEQLDAKGIASWIHFGVNHETKGKRKQILVAKKVNGKWQYSNYNGK